MPLPTGLIIVIGLLIVFLLSVSLLSAHFKYLSLKQKDDNEYIDKLEREIHRLNRQPTIIPKSKQRTKQRHEEVIDTLDYMLSNNIITQTEYNQLLTKTLPFLE